MGLTFREAEWNQMISSLDVGPESPLPESLFVTGPPGCGKNLLVSSVLEKLHSDRKILTFAKVSCVPASIHIREVFDSILRDVRSNLGLKSFLDVENAANFTDFAEKLSDILTSSSITGSKSCVIALSDAEILRSLDQLLLPGLLRLAELTRLNICVIFVSRIPWSRWQIIQWATICPITISLAPYNKKQLTDLLTSRLKSVPHPGRLDEAPDFFRNFADIILGTFFIVCRSFPQFLRVAQLLLPVYMSPVVNGAVEPNNATALWRLAEPHLKQCLAEVHLREDGLTFEAKPTTIVSSEMNNIGAGPTIAKPSRLSVELPFYSKFLLIAAFLASYNPAKSDKKFFVLNCGRIKKRKNPVTVSSHKRSSQLLGPKPFPLDRMLAIFYVIVDHKMPPRSKLMFQVKHLVSLQLLSQVGLSDVDSIEIPKFKCNVGLEFIRLVSINVKFEIHKYLYDANL